MKNKDYNIKSVMTGGHYRMERFTVIASILLFLLLISLASIHKTHLTKTKITLSNESMYTTDFVTSVTGISGRVLNICANEDATKGFIFFKVDDTNKLSMSADNYTVFITGTDGPAIAQPAGNVYIFGTSGYIGIYLSDTSGFDAEILKLIIRVGDKKVKDEDVVYIQGQDSSFQQYDQFIIYCNVGAKNAQRVKFLEKTNFTASDIYKELINDALEVAAVAALNESVSLMKYHQDNIYEYKTRLETLGMKSPDNPKAILGDMVTTDEDGNLAFEPKTIVAGGFEYDWYDNGLDAGYIKDVIIGESYGQFFNNKNNEIEQIPFTIPTVWYRASGSEFIYDSTYAISADKAINETIDNLATAWRDFYNEKVRYQKVLLREPLMLEIEMKSIDEYFNSKSDVVINW